MLKIIKIAEGLFKHVINKSTGLVLYNTPGTRLGIKGNTVTITSGGFTQVFSLNEILLYDTPESDPIEFVSIDDLITKLIQWGYPFLGNNVDISTYLGIDVAGKTRDESMDIVQVFSDGTVQTIYFDTAGDWAGLSKRE